MLSLMTEDAGLFNSILNSEDVPDSTLPQPSVPRADRPIPSSYWCPKGCGLIKIDLQSLKDNVIILGCEHYMVCERCHQDREDMPSFDDIRQTPFTMPACVVPRSSRLPFCEPSRACRHFDVCFHCQPFKRITSKNRSHHFHCMHCNRPTKNRKKVCKRCADSLSSVENQQHSDQALSALLVAGAELTRKDDEPQPADANAMDTTGHQQGDGIDMTGAAGTVPAQASASAPSSAYVSSLEQEIVNLRRRNAALANENAALHSALQRMSRNGGMIEVESCNPAKRQHSQVTSFDDKCPYISHSLPVQQQSFQSPAAVRVPTKVAQAEAPCEYSSFDVSSIWKAEE